MTLIDSVDSILMLYSYTAFAERSFVIFEKTEACIDLAEATEAAVTVASSLEMYRESSAEGAERDTAASEQPTMSVALQVKQNAMSGLSIILTLMSILVAFR